MLDLSIIIKCKEDFRLFECIDSIDEDVEIIVTMTRFPEIENRLEKMGIAYVFHPAGRLGLANNLGIEKSTQSNLIIMDSDSVFAPGAVGIIYKALQDGNLVVKPKIIYQADKSVKGSQVVAEYRDFLNNHQDLRAWTPGISLKKEVKDYIGYYFHDIVTFIEDAEFNSRLKKKNVPIFPVPDALIFHAPLSRKSDLYSAYRMGIGQRLGVETANLFPRENVKYYLQRLGKGQQFLFFKRVKECKGWKVAFYMVLWSIYFYTGYYHQRITGKFTPINIDSETIS
jgi:hypothetical protein